MSLKIKNAAWLKKQISIFIMWTWRYNQIILIAMVWVCNVHHHIVRQISQFVKPIHNSSSIHLASRCRLPHYPREDKCGSEALGDPDGTFPTIRFGLPLENDPFPVCDTNVSSSAHNEVMPPNEHLKIPFLWHWHRRHSHLNRPVDNTHTHTHHTANETCFTLNYEVGSGWWKVR